MTDFEFLGHMLAASMSGAKVTAAQVDRLRGLSGVTIARPMPSDWEGTIDPIHVKWIITRFHHNNPGHIDRKA